MRSPPTGALGESSSASFQSERRGTPPASIVPVGGLRMSQTYAHEAVMTAEVVDLFGPVSPGLIVDATLGGGGHAAALLRANPGITILGIDRDPLAVAAATGTLAPFGNRATVRQSRFDAVAGVVNDVRDRSGTPVDQGGVSGVLFDLGVSSPQLDVPGRGFSYRRDAVLDMRMDPTTGRTAADVVNQYEEDALVEIFADNGEGRFARRIARAIVAARPLTTTGQLADVVREAIPAATRRTGGHPARRVVPAIRIAVNEELDQLATALGGRARPAASGRSVRGHRLPLGRGPPGQVVLHPHGDRQLPVPARTSLRLWRRSAVPAGGPRRPPPLRGGGGPQPAGRGRPAPGHRAPPRCHRRRRRHRPPGCDRGLRRRGSGLMAPPTSVAHPLPSRAAPRPEPQRPRRPPLRILEPRRRRRPATRSVRRSTMWVSGVLVVGSLLAVVAGDALVQPRARSVWPTPNPSWPRAVTVQKGLQVEVAGKAAPPVVVQQAKSQGLVTSPQVVYLPQVPLNVPLPIPQTAPLAGQ